jgi:three-Cys-motif partner protein
MVDSEDHFDEFEPHTRLKHLILKAYVASWAFKMLLRPGAGDKVYFIDACAGAGMDEQGHHGSPVIAAVEAAVARSKVREMTQRPVEVVTIAIEKEAPEFRSLEANLAPFAPRARALRGELRNHLPALLEEIGDSPILCFIDPFGVEPLRAQVVRAILQRRHCEVFVLLHDQGCLRHYGAVSSIELDEDSGSTDLFGVLEGRLEPKPLTARQEASELARQVTAARAVEILDAAFDVIPWRMRLEASPHAKRRAEFVHMYKDLLADCGARYVLPIPIRNNGNQHVYHLIHASHSASGLMAMKQAVSSALNKTDLDATAADTIRFAIRSPLRKIVGDIATRFAGRVMPWTKPNADGLQPLGEYVLAETPVFPHEIAELKELLKRFKQKGKSLVYQFPGERAAGLVTPSDRAGR